MTKKLVSFDDQAEPGQGLPAAVKAELNATYADREVVTRAVDEGAVARRIPEPFAQATPIVQSGVRRYLPGGAPGAIDTPGDGTARAVGTINGSVSITVPEGGGFRFTLNATAYVRAGATYHWVLMVDGQPVQSTKSLVCTAPAGSATLPNRYTVEGVLRHDGTGAALVPGRRIAVAWGHSCTSGTYGHLVTGGDAGAPTWALTPISSRINERRIVGDTFGPNTHIPLWLCHNRIELLGTPPAQARVSWSPDEGGTWTTHGQTLSSTVQAVREMDNGEIVVFCGRKLDDSIGPSIWVSSGWATDHATATFTMTCEQQGTTTDGSWREWSVDTYGPLVFAAEYGPKDGPANMARYLYMSEDYGQTWSIIYDLMDLATADGSADGTSYHLHGVAYDPWWDAIWLTTGDFSPQCATLVSFDRGKTWKMVTRHHQFTTIYALPNCILATTDMGGKNGIWRIERTHPDGPFTGSWAWLGADDSGLRLYGNQAFRVRGVADAPLVFSFQTGPTADSGRAVITYDGHEFHEIWRDSQTYTNRGLFTMIGPTRTGRYWGRLSRTGMENVDAEALRITSSPA